MSDIETLKNAMIQAYQSGDMEAARRYALAYKKAKGEDVDITMANALGKSGARGFGRMRSGLQKGLSLATELGTEKGRQEREDIKQYEAQAEAELEPYREAYPVTSFIGEMAAPTLLSGGRTVPMAAARGGLTGLLSYTPESNALQAGFGMAGGALGTKLAGQLKPLGKRAKALGMKSTPEESIPTFLPKEKVSGLQAYRVEAFKSAKFNQERITRQALAEMGETTSKFTDDTLVNVQSRANKLFDAAIGSKENIFVPMKTLNFLDSFSVEQNVSGVGRKAAARWAKDIQRDIIKNKGVLSVDKYQQFRSDITDEIISATKGKKKRVLGELIDWLDDNASKNLSEDTLGKFNEARRLWKNYSMYKTLSKRAGGIDYESGLLDPNKLNRILLNKDESGFLLKRNPSKVYEMLRVNQQLAGHGAISSSASDNLGSLRIGMAGGGGPSVGYYSNRLINEPLGRFGLSLNRLPGDIVSDVIPGSIPPAMQLSPLLGEE